MPTSVELFSGTAPFSHIMSKKGFSTVTIDIEKKFNPSICCDVLNLDYNLLPKNVDVLWASPDCRYLSRAANQRHWVKKTVGYRQYVYHPATEEAKKSIALVSRTVAIIKEINPRIWFIENPVGRIQHLSSMKSIGHYRYSVNYKDWGFSYSKETYIFTNQLLNLPVKKQIRPGIGLRSVHNRVARSVVPSDLINFLIEHSIL